MGAARPAGAPDVCEQCCVDTGDLEVVVLDGDGVQDTSHEGCAGGTSSVVCEFDADEQLCRCYRSDRDVVFISDEPIELATAPFGVDENCRVQNQAGH
jgi:hypothetical protein